MTKLFSKALGLVVSILGGMLASALFKRVWKAITGEEDAPKATDARRGWREILLAAALQGAIFAEGAVDYGEDYVDALAAAAAVKAD